MVSRSYLPGMAHYIRFGGVGDGEDRMILTLWGDMNHPSAPFAMDAATARIPAEAELADHQVVSFYFGFASRPYGEVYSLFEQVADRLEVEGWQIVPANEEFPGTTSSMNDLTEVADFPSEPQAHGYNAAGGFIVVMEKSQNPPRFSEQEREDLVRLAHEFSILVFGRELEVQNG